MHRLSLQCELPVGGTGLYSSPSPRHPTYCRDLINSSCLSSQKCRQLQRPLMGPRQSQTLTSPTTQKEARKRWMDIKELEVSHQDRVPPVCKAPDRTSQRKSSRLCHRQIDHPCQAGLFMYVGAKSDEGFSRCIEIIYKHLVSLIGQSLDNLSTSPPCHGRRP